LHDHPTTAYLNTTTSYFIPHYNTAQRRAVITDIITTIENLNLTLYSQKITAIPQPQPQTEARLVMSDDLSYILTQHNLFHTLTHSLFPIPYNRKDHV
jgi:hypothetical protein